MASSKTSTPEDAVIAESARIDEQIAAVHERKVALVAGDDKAAAKLSETVFAAPVGDDAVETKADADNKKGDS